MTFSLWTWLNLLFIGVLPGLWVQARLALAFFGKRGSWRQTAIFALTHGAFSATGLFVLPPSLLTLLSMLSFVLLFALSFRHIKPVERISIAIFALLLSFVVEIASGLVWLPLFPQEQLLSNPLYTIFAMWPLFALVLALALLLERTGVSPGQRMLLFLQTAQARLMLYLALLSIVQFIVLVFLLPAHMISDNPLYFSLIFIAGVLSLAIMYMAVRTTRKAMDKGVRISQQVYIEDVNRMFTAIRGQRHDFLNHVQVIRSMVSRKKYEELERYTRELAGEVTELNEVLQIGHPALAALIRTKMAVALDKKVTFSYDLTGFAGSAIGLKSIDIVKIVGNLLDNALEAAELLPAGERRVEIVGQCVDRQIELCVRNYGSLIPPERIAQLFEPGFTTKQKDGHAGIGLPVVKQLVEYYKGQLHVSSDREAGTAFSVTLPAAV